MPVRKQPAAADQVRQAAAHQRGAGRGQHERRADPGQRADVEPDTGADLRQRDVQDREVDGQEEARAEQHGQGGALLRRETGRG
jgi:hypothetical protein